MRTVRRSVLILGFCSLATSVFPGVPTWAQETRRVRGTVEAVQADGFAVKSRDGETLAVRLTDKPLFVAIVRSSMADIKPGMFVGATAMPGSDGRPNALLFKYAQSSHGDRQDRGLGILRELQVLFRTVEAEL